MSPMSPPDEDVYCTMEVEGGYEIMTPPKCDFGESTGLRPQPVASFMCYAPTTKQESPGKGPKNTAHVNTDYSRKGVSSNPYVNTDPSRIGTNTRSCAHANTKAPVKGTQNKTCANNDYINDFMEFDFGQEEFRERAASDGKISRPRDGKIFRSPSGSQIASNNGGRKRANTFSGPARGHAHLNELERQLYSPQKLLRAHSPAHSPTRNHDRLDGMDGLSHSPPRTRNRLDRMDELQENDVTDECDHCVQRPEYHSELYFPLTALPECKCSQRLESNPEVKRPVKIPCMIVSEPKDISEQKAEKPKTESPPFSLAAYNPNFPEKRASTSSLNIIPENTNVSVNPNYVSVDFTPGEKGVKDNKIHLFEDLMDIDFRSRSGSDSAAMRRRQLRKDGNQEQRSRSGSHGSSSSLAKIRSLFTRRKVV